MQPLKNFRHFLGLLVLMLGLGGLLGATAAQATECKGMSKSKCEAADQCTWVKSYKTKKGATVEAYCRSKPSKSGKKESTSKSKSDTSKSTVKKEDKKDSKNKDTKKETKKKEKKEKKSSSKSDSSEKKK